uniref:Uncharacterized protein n=1 Tax=Avena sativa TaxID=4498 RepID=A0ACD5XBA3_AVESA
MSQELVEPAAMAAATDEVPTPFAAASVPPPAKTKKDSGSCPETPPSPARPAVETAAGWSSLLPDLVRRVANCFLDTNDVDWYMDLRAVCQSWRAATDDPRKNPFDGRFHPREWIVLDDGVSQTDDTRVFVNIGTGRFLRKKLPLRRRYYLVAITFGGYFVLADRKRPHATRVLNPFTGELVRVAAPVPRGAGVAVFFFSGDTPHNLTLLCGSSRKYYTAVPDSKRFVAHSDGELIYNYMRKAVVGGVYTNGGGWASVANEGMIENLCKLTEMLQVEFVKFFSCDPFRHTRDVRCFLVDFGGQAMFITKAPGRLVPVETIGKYAIFIGHHRCLVVDAGKFPSVEANCVYYTLQVSRFAGIVKHNIGDGTDVRVSESLEFFEQNNEFVFDTPRPLTIIQVLCSYTINLRGSELA